MTTPNKTKDQAPASDSAFTTTQEPERATAPNIMQTQLDDLGTNSRPTTDLQQSFSLATEAHEQEMEVRIRGLEAHKQEREAQKQGGGARPEDLEAHKKELEVHKKTLEAHKKALEALALEALTQMTEDG